MGKELSRNHQPMFGPFFPLPRRSLPGAPYPRVPACSTARLVQGISLYSFIFIRVHSFGALHLTLMRPGIVNTPKSFIFRYVLYFFRLFNTTLSFL